MVASNRKVTTMPGKSITDLKVSKYKELTGKFNVSARATHPRDWAGSGLVST